jgi:hypothetical protein
MSNSKLATVTILSPNCNVPRQNVIDTITIHHMACNLTVEQCGQGFANPARQASSNYGIGSDGRIGLYVSEANRSWCSSSPPNDHRAITIEVANDKPSDEGGWHVSNKALASLINLCADICKRNGKTKMIWCGTLKATEARKFASNEMRMTLHKWFAATGCPGPYLEGKMQYIADEVTKRLKPAPKTLIYKTTKDTPIVSIKGVEPKGKTVKIGGRKTVCGVQYGRIDGTKDDWISLKDCKQVK